MPNPPRPPLPPLKAGSAQDIASFAALDLALRSHPELAREGVNVLNAKALSKLVDGIRTFQDDQLGKQSKSKYWPILRIPDDIFRDRSRSGPLFTALLSAYRQKSSSSWRSFDFTSPKRFDDNIALLRRIEKDLTTAGFLKRPIIYFDTTVPKERKPGLITIAEKFGATVVTDYTKATHVVAGDEEFDLEEDVLEEERKEREGVDIEKMYLRTVAVVDPTKEIATGDGGGNSGGGKKKVGNKSHPMALVHWWFWPSSYDEWMAASDVAGDVEQAPPPRPPGGPWCVGCKFVRDVALFNEWGVETDYAVDDYKKKVALYKTPPTKEESKGKKSSRTSTGGKKGSKGNNDTNKTESSGSNKKSTSSSSAQSQATSPNSTSKVSSSSGVGGSSSKKDRRAGHGLNPRQINTGYYGPRGERIRRTVHDGALRVPPHASAIVHDALYEFTGLSKNPLKTHDLPGLDRIVRPSIDPSLGPTISVTELSSVSVGMSSKTHVRNRLVSVPMISDDEPVRIRGGGGGENDNKAFEDHSTQQHAPIAPSTAASITGPGQISGRTESTQSITGVPSFQSVPLQQQQPQGGMIGLDSLTAALEQKNTSVNQVTAPPPEPAQQPQQCDNAPVVAMPNRKEDAAQQPPQISSVSLPKGVIHSAPAVPKHGSVPIMAGPSHPVASTVPVSTSGAIQTATSMAPPAPSLPIPVPSQQKSTTEAVAPQIGPTAASTIPQHVTTGVIGKQQQIGAGTTNSQPAQPRVHATQTHSTPAAPMKLPPVQQGRSVGKVLNFAAAPSVKKEGTTNADISAQMKTTNTPAKVGITATQHSVNVAGATQPSAVRSSTVGAHNHSAPAPPKVLALPQNPAQGSLSTSNSVAGSAVATHTSGSGIHGEQATPADQDATVNAPPWYNSRNTSDFERNMLPEWFNGSAPHRNPSNYVESREKMIGLARRSSNRFITGTAVRRCVPGDAGSLLRLHKFLVTWGFINGSSINESAPTSAGLRKTNNESKDGGSLSSQGPSMHQNFWTKDRSEILAKEVVRQANKRRKVTGSGNNHVNIEWDVVASAIGDGVTAFECQRTFLGLALEDDNNEEKKDTHHTEIERTPHIMHGWQKHEMFRELLDGIRPEVAKAALDASMAATDDVLEAQKASLFGVIAGQALEQARNEEDVISRLLMEVVDQRMNKLENRLALLDDVEGMLEAERVALELERRDLYTARCRHWLGDG